MGTPILQSAIAHNPSLVRSANESQIAPLTDALWEMMASDPSQPSIINAITTNKALAGFGAKIGTKIETPSPTKVRALGVKRIAESALAI